MNRTKIEYGTHAWDPVTGCSYGCLWGCWADRKQHGHADFRHPMCHPERLDEPMREKKAARVLVSFVGDLFGPEVPDWFVYEVFSAAERASQHEYFVLTQRANRMKDHMDRFRNMPPRWLHLGVTVTTQAEADERIPLLLATPAVKRWVSIEPMLGPVDLDYAGFDGGEAFGARRLGFVVVGSIDRPTPQYPAPKREWIESIRERCKASGVPLWEKTNLRTRGTVRDRKLVQELPT